MKRLLILLLCLEFVFCDSIAQTVDISCNRCYSRYAFGYLNYNAYPLGTVLEITFKRNFWRIDWATITDIRAIGRIKIEKENLDPIVYGCDSIIETVSQSSAYNIALSLNTNNDTIKKKINDIVSRDLDFVLLCPRDSSILDITSVREDFMALDLPPLKKKNTVYAICNRVIYSDNFLLGFVRDRNFSSTLSIDVSKEVSATGQIAINNYCNHLVNIVGTTYGFFTFTGISADGETITEYQVSPNDISTTGTSGGNLWGNYSLSKNRVVPIGDWKYSSCRPVRDKKDGSYNWTKKNSWDKDKSKFKLPGSFEKKKLFSNNLLSKRSKK
ncbi:MAG: hypothetical protein C5B59_13465 [Bacteroidetes bacterium]|nr:MAG: hypothetical protein C5B59_13465 [Bacteroidota bacterium]